MIKNDPQAPASSPDKSPQERFEELGRKLMAVPKTELDSREKAWQADRKRARKRR